MAGGYPCSAADCDWVTRLQVPDDVDNADMYQLLQLQLQELQIHTQAAHGTGTLSANTDDAVELTNVENAEQGDSATTADHIEPCNSSTSRSKKSKKRTKSRRTDVHSSGELAIMIS